MLKRLTVSWSSLGHLCSNNHQLLKGMLRVARIPVNAYDITITDSKSTPHQLGKFYSFFMINQLNLKRWKIDEPNTGYLVKHTVTRASLETLNMSMLIHYGSTSFNHDITRKHWPQKARPLMSTIFWFGWGRRTSQLVLRLVIGERKGIVQFW